MMNHPTPVAASPKAVADHHRRLMLDAMVRREAALAAGQVDLAAAFRDRARMHRAEMRDATGTRKPA